MVVLQAWHIFTRTRTTAMFYLKCKLVRTCDFCDKNPLNGFKNNCHKAMKGITRMNNFTFQVEHINSTSSSENVPGLQHYNFHICSFCRVIVLNTLCKMLRFFT